MRGNERNSNKVSSRHDSAHPAISPASRRAMGSKSISGSDAALITRAQLHPEEFFPDISNELNGSFNATTPKPTTIYSSTILQEKMTDKGRDFFTLREDKFFASHEDVSTDPFHTAVIIKNLPPQERTKTIITLNSLRNILGVNSLSEVRDLLEDDSARKEASKRGLRLLGNMYGIKGTEDDVERVIKNYAETANSVIDTIRGEELSENSGSLEMINDVASTHDPVQLLLMTFDNSYDPRIRFEAKRKIVLMFLAANIDMRENEIEVTKKQSKLDEFLTEFVFTKHDRKGQIESVYYLSAFDPETYDCTSVHVLKPDQVDPARKTYIDPESGEKKILGEHQKLIGATRRAFMYKGKNIPIRIKNPPKAAVRKVLKLIRKGVGNPAVAVDDDVRMMGIVDNYDDAYKFMAHLQNSAINAGSFMDFEGVEDTIQGGKRAESPIGNAVGNGGSSELQWIKFHARFGLPGEKPVYIEVMLHTNETYMNYEYKHRVAHREFATRRFFGDDDELATADLLFPKIHYGIEIKLGREQRLAKVRYELEKEAAGVKQSS